MARGFFKFLNSQHIDAVLSGGTVTASRLSYFRKLEGDPWIADPDEATTVVRAGGASISAGLGQSASEAWSPAGYENLCVARDGGTIRFSSDARLSYQFPDCFIFSTSLGDRGQLIQAMCRDAEQPYDAAVRILVSLEELAHKILYRGIVVELDNEPARRVFSAVRSRSVTYDAVDHHHAGGHAPEPLPFRKHPFYAAQSEARIVLFPGREIGFERLTIKLPNPEKIFAEEFRRAPTLTAA
jgi:hypothetical protein